MCLRPTPYKCGCSLHNDTQTDNAILRKTSSVARLKSYKGLLENKLINSREYVGSSCPDLYKPASTSDLPVDQNYESTETDQQEPVCHKQRRNCRFSREFRK